MRPNRFVFAAFAAAFLTALGLAVFASPSQAQDQVTVPTVAGQTTTVSWQGTILPGVEPSSECGSSDLGADAHEVDVVVPVGAYDQVSVQATATLSYSGPVDVIFTVVFPDGSTLSADNGFVDTDESLGFADPQPGLYRFIACMFAGAVPQAYTGSLTLEATTEPLTSSKSCKAPGKPLSFTPPAYVDTDRAGGEPMVLAHPNGTLLYAGHESTTLIHPEGATESSSAYTDEYRGQVNAWYSDDHGATWHYVDRTLPPDNSAGSGFSDPDYAIDAAGNVYLSEINLVNVAVSKSTDAGHSYTLQNFFAEDVTDRQWSAAGPANVLFMVGNADEGGTVPTDPAGNNGHLIYRSTDGGRTFSEAVEDPGGLGDLVFDQGSGTLYEAHYEGGSLVLAAFRNALAPDDTTALTPEKHTIARGVNLLSHWPAIDVDSAGNVYVAWDETGNGGREAGVWYSYSNDRGNTWAEPVEVSPDDRTDIWPWIAVGDAGRVAVAWFGADRALPSNDPEQATADDGWNVYVAQTTSGLGCYKSPNPGFHTTQATPDPFHTGAICMGGTTCEAGGPDRRLGDYFTIDVDTTGAVVVAYSDTRQGGAVALPAFLRQSGGTIFFSSGHGKSP